MTWDGSDRRSRLPANWPAICRRVHARDGWRCQIRGPSCTITSTQVDHITRGDDHRLANLQAVCATCHAAKSAAEGVAARAAVRARDRRAAEQHPGLTDP